MNASPIAQMSHSVTSVMAGALGSGLAWCVARFSRAPVTSTGIVLIVLAYGAATGNALFWQSERHPAPMFASYAEEPVPAIEPVEVASTTQQPVVSTPAATPGPATSQPMPAEVQTPAPEQQASIGNEDVARMQEKLKAMGLFNGTVDGYYGPRTADAIRAFEERAGMPRTGAISPAVLEAVENAALTTSEVPAIDSASVATLIAESPEVAPAPSEPADVPAPPETVETALAVLETVPEDGPTWEETNVFASLLALARPEPSSQPVQPALDTQLVSAVQEGLSQLGFLRGPTNGIAGDETARAIRNFEIFHNFEPSGAVSYALLDRLVAAGAEL